MRNKPSTFFVLASLLAVSAASQAGRIVAEKQLQTVTETQPQATTSQTQPQPTIIDEQPQTVTETPPQATTTQTQPQPTINDEQPRIISADQPLAILEIAKGFGSAELKTDSDGDPRISGRIDGTKYGLLFYGCTDGEGCTHIQLVAGWSGGGMSMEAINEWNKSTKFGKAYTDSDGDPWLELTINLAHGVTAQNLDDTFDWWRIALDGFKDSMASE